MDNFLFIPAKGYIAVCEGEKSDNIQCFLQDRKRLQLKPFKGDLKYIFKPDVLRKGLHSNFFQMSI